MFLLTVRTLGWIGELLSDVKSTTAVDLEEGDTATTGHVGNLDELDASESFRRGRLYLVTVERFEVVEIAQLAGLTHAFTTGESLMSVELETIVNVVKVADVQQKRGDCCACTTLA